MSNEQPKRRIQDDPVAPEKLFDDVYYIGRRGVGVFAVTTEEGIVLIDSMDPTDADEKHIVPGLTALGLDPHDLKLIILTHGHFDHFAGARRLQKRFHCQVALGEKDSAFMVSSDSRLPLDSLEYPHIDLFLEDGKEITVGRHRFLPVLTPGHTPGCMSLIFNCHDQGEEHWVSLWGGAGLPRPVEPLGERMRDCCLFANSALQFKLVCDRYHCDVILGTHPHRCDLFEKLAALKERAEGAPHPFVVGSEAVRDNLHTRATEALQLAQELADGM